MFALQICSEQETCQLFIHARIICASIAVLKLVRRGWTVRVSRYASCLALRRVCQGDVCGHSGVLYRLTVTESSDHRINRLYNVKTTVSDRQTPFSLSLRYDEHKQPVTRTVTETAKTMTATPKTMTIKLDSSRVATCSMPWIRSTCSCCNQTYK